MAVDYSKFIYAGKSATPFLDQYKKQAATQKTNLDNRLAGLKSDRDTYRANQQGIYNAYRKTLGEKQASDESKSNAEYDSTQRQNYINYMQAQKNLPSQLNALGIRGGASESSALRLGTNYGQNVANTEGARNSALAALRQAYANQLADYDKEYRQLLASYDDTYNANVRDARSAYADTLNSLYATAQQNQQQWEQTQIDNDLTRFASAIKGQFGSQQGYLDLIAQLQKSKDPNKAAKIMLTRQAMNEWLKENPETSSGGGGGGGGGGYSRSYGGYSGGGYSSSSSGGGGSSSSNAQAINDKYRNRASQGRNPSGQTRSSGSSSSGRKSVSSSYYTGSYRTSKKKSSGSSWLNRLFRR